MSINALSLNFYGPAERLTAERPSQPLIDKKIGELASAIHKCPNCGRRFPSDKNLTQHFWCMSKDLAGLWAIHHNKMKTSSSVKIGTNQQEAPLLPPLAPREKYKKRNATPRLEPDIVKEYEAAESPGLHDIQMALLEPTEEQEPFWPCAIL